MGDGGKWYHVHFVSYNSHTKKGTRPGEAPPTMRVTYICGGNEEFSEWVCIEHPSKGIAYRRAVKWILARDKYGDGYIPGDVEEAVGRSYCEPTRIRVVPEGQYKRISAYEFD